MALADAEGAAVVDIGLPVGGGSCWAMASDGFQVVGHALSADRLQVLARLEPALDAPAPRELDAVSALRAELDPNFSETTSSEDA